MNNLLVLIPIGAATLAIAGFIIAWLLNDNTKLKDKISAGRKENAENKIGVIGIRLDKLEDTLTRKIDNLVTIQLLDAKISEIKREQKHDLSIARISLQGEVNKAKIEYNNAVNEQRGLKRRTETLLGKIIDNLLKQKSSKIIKELIKEAKEIENGKN